MRLMITNAEATNPEAYLSLGLSTSCKKVPRFPRILSLISSILETTVAKTENKLDSFEIKETASVFSGTRAPTLSIQRYIERIFKYANCSPSCFLLGYIYIERFLEQPNICLTSLNVHRLIITSVVVAAKFMDDAIVGRYFSSENLQTGQTETTSGTKKMSTCLDDNGKPMLQTRMSNILYNRSL
ncbi:cyclin-P3-1-like isoform X2 [Zingiber officinale]|uniref:cyclin-P3-1-like isoform X2 n=1 Tax=Zingiber officinale TaxID=94328 RepID=UPI001C4D9C86|nr:cyclin-P3-1-like isoform X2 [Zingiber officinale]